MQGFSRAERLSLVSNCPAVLCGGSWSPVLAQNPEVRGRLTFVRYRPGRGCWAGRNAFGLLRQRQRASARHSGLLSLRHVLRPHFFNGGQHLRSKNAAAITLSVGWVKSGGQVNNEGAMVAIWAATLRRSESHGGMGDLGGIYVRPMSTGSSRRCQGGQVRQRQGSSRLGGARARLA